MPAAWFLRKVLQVGLFCVGVWADFAHVLLDGALTDLDGELEQFASDVLGAPETVVPGHLADEVDGLLRDTGRSLVGLGLATPIMAIGIRR